MKYLKELIPRFGQYTGLLGFDPIKETYFVLCKEGDEDESVIPFIHGKSKIRCFRWLGVELSFNCEFPLNEYTK